MTETETFAAFLDDVRNVFASSDDQFDQATRVASLTREVIAEAGWLEEEVAAAGDNPHVLHVDDAYGYPDPGFLVMCPTGEPGDARLGGVPHDHGPTWVVYANYRGNVEHTKYRWSHADPEAPRLEAADSFVLEPGQVSMIMPGEIHKTETVGDGESWVLRVESQELATVPSHRYDVDAGTMVPVVDMGTIAAE